MTFTQLKEKIRTNPATKFYHQSLIENLDARDVVDVIHVLEETLALFRLKQDEITGIV